MVSNTKHDTLKVSMFTVALPSAQSRTIGAVPARWFGLSCAERLGCMRHHECLWLLTLVHHCDHCLRPPTITIRAPPGLKLLWYVAHALRLIRACLCPNGESNAVECFLRPERGWRSLEAPVATSDGILAVSDVKRAPRMLALTRPRPTQSPQALARPTPPPPLPAYNRAEASFSARRLDLCLTCVLGRRYKFLITRMRGVWRRPWVACVALVP